MELEESPLSEFRIQDLELDSGAVAGLLPLLHVLGESESGDIRIEAGHRSALIFTAFAGSIILIESLIGFGYPLGERSSTLHGQLSLTGIKRILSANHSSSRILNALSFRRHCCSVGHIETAVARMGLAGIFGS